MENHFRDRIANNGMCHRKLIYVSAIMSELNREFSFFLFHVLHFIVFFMFHFSYNTALIVNERNIM